MSVRFQLRRGTAAEWTAANPILAAGEPAVETDTHREKLGDGTTAWNSLGYVGDDAAAVAAHEADTTNIHGIANTALLETTAGAQAKVDAAVAALLAGAPGALDTLNELAAALGNDANLASTLTAAIAAKVSDTAYNAGTWDGVTTVAPSKNAVRDKIEALSGASAPVTGTAPTGDLPVPSPRTMLSTLQSGHGFTAPEGTLTANDATIFELGAQSAKVVAATSQAGSLQKTGLAADFTAKHLGVLIRVDSITNLDQINIYAGNSGLTSYYAWTPLRGTDSPAQLFAGEWLWMPLTFAHAAVTGTPNRAAIDTIKVKVLANASGSVQLNLNAVYTRPDASSVFPNGVVSIVFDDGHDDQFSQAAPSMDAYGFPGTAFVIADLIGSAGKMTVAQLQELQNLHGWEVAGHAYTFADHQTQFPNLSLSDLDTDLAGMRKWLSDNGFGNRAHIAYPGGQYNATVAAEITKYFASARTLGGAATPTTWPPADTRKITSLSSISGFAGGTSIATAQTHIDRAFTDKLWTILVFHHITSGAATATTECSRADFDTLMAYIAAKGIPVMTYGNVLAGRKVADTPALQAEQDWTLPAVALAQTCRRNQPTANAVFLNTGQLSLVGIYLRAGQVINNITFYSATTAASVPLNQWFALYDKNRNKLAVTADNTTTAWAAETGRTLALAAPYTVPTSGMYYLGICVVASTCPTLRSEVSGVVVTGTAPILAGVSTTGLTDPTTAPLTAAALTASGNFPYAYVS